MALVQCIECGKTVSDKAAACMNCGHPIPAPAPIAEAEVYEPPPKEKPDSSGKIILLIAIAGVVAMYMLGKSPSSPSASSSYSSESAKKECVAAMASSIGHSTTGYADKMAYEAVVRDKCAGFSIDGKPIGR